MIIPLDKLISHDKNSYILTTAAIKRAAQINLAGDDELEEAEGKIVSLAIKQVLTSTIEYKLEE
ncbi:MAG: DNA-directed RNA polymerase subunit omega [Spirochaetales bacterium]|nr:DNA-directed RNA polymerase subunit omega [Spirochaetales bacterium]